MNYYEISKETIGLLYQCRNSLNQSPLSQSLRILAELRVSQINGCAYCCRLHTEEALKLGVARDKIDSLADWGSSPAFAAEEKAALRWVEAVTRLDGDLEGAKEGLTQRYSEREIVDLTTAAGLMNALNRIVISLRG